MNILPQIAQITQTNAAGLHYHAEKDRLVEVKAGLGLRLVCGFGVRLRKSARSAGAFWGSICGNNLSTLM